MFLRPHRQQKRYAKWLIGCNLMIFVFGIKYLTFDPEVVRLGRLENYDDIKDENGRVLDTYFQRIKQFLNKENVSILSYEQSTVVDLNLIAKMKEEIVHLQKIEQKLLLNISQGQEIHSGCQKTCCWSMRKSQRFYNGEHDRIPMILDRVTQIDFKLLADIHYGRVQVPTGISLPRLTYEILPCLQNDTVIFVDTPELGNFFRRIHSQMSVNYILLTGDSDLSCPLYFMRSHDDLLAQIFSGQTRIRHWFSMNCHFGKNPQWANSKIFTCIPQGLSQWSEQRYFIHLAHGKDDSIANTQLKTNEYWMLTSFNQNNGFIRRQLWDLSCHGRLKNVSKCFYNVNSLDQWKYYLHMARSKFVLSPPGNGLDCYRTWEALYLGSIPIILQTSINRIFDKLPVFIVNSYDEITPQLLEQVYQNMTRQKYDYNRLYKGYWQHLINSYRNSTEAIQIFYRSL